MVHASSQLSRAETFLNAGREAERFGRLDDAIAQYVAAAEPSLAPFDIKPRTEALRRHASIRRRRQEFTLALALCRESYDLAVEGDEPLLAAEAVNGVGLVYMEQGQWEDAGHSFEQALALADHRPDLRGRIEQNLGILANMQGDYASALQRYQGSLNAFRAAGDDRMCANAYHNLGMISADRQRWEDAHQYFQSSLDIADATGDIQLRAKVLLNRTEVHLAQQHYEDARRSAEEALRILDQVGVRQGKSEAYKFLGVLYRETGSTTLAEARLRTAMTLAADTGAVLEEAEAARELAILFQRLDRNYDALTLLNKSHVLFHRLGARADAQDVTSKVATLEQSYMEVVASWGQSIESADSYTYGHCERVAKYAVAVATTLGWDTNALTTVRIGAYLHDLGKVRVPHEILNKPGRLTPGEREIMEMHPIYGIELVAAVEFPWRVKPIIRSHHERQDGTGYPDKLRGEEIPVEANVICIVDVFDALTTTRSYRSAMSVSTALTELQTIRHWWRGDIYDAFMASVGAGEVAR